MSKYDIPEGPGIGIDKWAFEVHLSPVTVQWDHLVDKMAGKGSFAREEDPPWNLNPTYQRGPVWNPHQQELFIGHVLSGGIVQPIICQRYENARHAPATQKDYWNIPVEVIDGQQRLRAIQAFLNGEIWARVFHDECWRGYSYAQTSHPERRGMTSQVAYIDLPLRKRLEFYLRLNSAGTHHTQEDLNKVREML